ncbi:1-(5-phosphoribosyl)-5-[(5-phosphoribosylamino)methylideneamino]imidazole-4-carboxamide isomerase [Desulfohalobium retbaense]|uniref:1-(5-phosphoribosyl)-5-[(5-phosphoribosylamino)methylideneamino] imidazole-4-carboxamide isomerase n=1 Tax=Desulfohalobium retbaense (strain ATCC 49708 / DSM 5692 / JCM 16813 / HR100) TaxID=485915 RepID=C8X1I5_DESRD|nr:1-(5-phosphoribosyl)-5-[(5-phosphoribosylamino)methylideneamino]imidazole-4-carboxamide isomerase [Desulfohalobium retbaense]ACV68282.1 phosphoribosylformimino-5-aminoimidazole carboxamide ribotide isomerase [Desulfohalobium retbaense DSM 5692]
MILFPAVDIQDGQCVRLKQGKADAVTVFSPDPLAVSRHWETQGASWLHVVDLDGAFSGMPRNYDLIRSICDQVTIPVQLGGGIRDAATAEKYLEAGVARLIIGTMALEQPETFRALCRAHPGRIGVSLDAEDGWLKTKGWVENSGRRVAEVVPELEPQGVAFVVYTDIARDGMQSGVNLRALEELLDSTGLPVIVAGGVATLEDLQSLHPLREKGLAGVITGKAIYSGSLDFPAALEWLRCQP